MPVHGTPENEELQAEMQERLRRRIFLCSMVASKAKAMADAGEHFDIMDTKHWEHARFADIAQLTIEKLQDPKMKKAFMDTFKRGYQEQLTYYEFYNLMTKTLGLDKIEEWRYEDFETTIDNFGLAFMELNDVVKWLLDHGYDLGVPVKETDLEDEFAKKAAITP
jgi:tryptophan 2,3-dioxygenase